MGSFYRPGAEARVSAMAERLAVFPPNGSPFGAQARAREVIGDVQARRCSMAWSTSTRQGCGGRGEVSNTCWAMATVASGASAGHGG